MKVGAETGRAVVHECRDRVAQITLNRPGHGNALNSDLAAGLSAAVQRADADPGVRAILLRAEGKNFCVGGDLAQLAAAGDHRAATMRGILDDMHRVIRILHTAAKPVVVAVQGAVAGGGLGLALVADLVVVEPASRFVFAYPHVGLTPDCGVSWLLPRIVGPRRAFAMALASETPQGAQLVDSGLATVMVPAEEVQQRALELALQSIAAAPDASGAGRSLLRGHLTADLDTALRNEEQTILHAVESERAVELMSRFG